LKDCKNTIPISKEEYFFQITTGDSQMVYSNYSPLV
jgi:hypothetical protein